MRPSLAVLSVASLSWCAGCNIENGVSGLADSLLDPEPSTIQGPGRRIAQGSYSDLELDASLSVGARLLALRHDREESELAIIPFEGGDACHVGPATRFMRLASQVDVHLTPIVGYLGERTNGQGTLHFVDFDCREVMDPIDQVGLPQVLYPRGNATGLLTLSGSGMVYFIDVTKPEVRVVAENVHSGRVGNSHLWLIEEGTLLARNDSFDVEVRYGTSVVEFGLFSGLYAPGVTDAAYIEDGKLFLAAGTSGEPEELAQDACAITDIGHAGAFAFYSPCASRRLAIAYRSDLVGLDAGVLVAHLSEQALDPRQIDLFWGDGQGAALFLVGEDASADSGELVFQGFDSKAGTASEAVSLGEQAHIDAGGVVFLDYDAGVGELSQVLVENDDSGRPEFKALEKLAHGVAQLPGVTVSSSVGVLGNFDADDETGDLLLFSNDLDVEPKRLARRVPVQRHARDGTRQRSAFVADFENETGTAYVLDGKEPVPLGNHVLPNSLQFVDLPESIAYLVTSGARERALTLYLLEPRLEVTLNTRVNEFHSLPWPSPGMLYSVDQGSSSGIWFARAK
ncbi:MAG TPA: hypothetical protein VI197_10545 [Polyangiaceae bacterium]